MLYLNAAHLIYNTILICYYIIIGIGIWLDDLKLVIFETYLWIVEVHNTLIFEIFSQF